MRKNVRIMALVLLFSLLVSFISVATSDEEWKENALSTLRGFFVTINLKDFKTAYENYTRYWDGELSYELFYDDWKINRTVELVDAEVIQYTPNTTPAGYMGGTKAVLKIRFYSEDYISGKLHKAYYTGKAYMSLTEVGCERGFRWVIDDLKYEEENTIAETTDNLDTIVTAGIGFTWAHVGEATPSEIERKLGEPNEIENNSTILRYNYRSYNLSFNFINYILTSIIVEGAEYKTEKGIKVGDSREAVKKTYPNAGEHSKADNSLEDHSGGIAFLFDINNIVRTIVISKPIIY